MGKGIVVINAATLETLNEAVGGLERAGFRVRVSQVSVARLKPVGAKRLLAALNPVFVIAGERDNGGRLYVIGVGPGDPELITLKGARILGEVGSIFVPKGGRRDRASPSR